MPQMAPYITPVSSNVQSVLSQRSTRLRLFDLLYDIEVKGQKTIKHAFMFYTLVKHVFDQSERAERPVYIIKRYNDNWIIV